MNHEHTQRPRRLRHPHPAADGACGVRFGELGVEAMDMTELEKLKEAHEKLQRDYDALLNTHVLHLLVASEMMGLKVPKMKELH